MTRLSPTALNQAIEELMLIKLGHPNEGVQRHALDTAAGSNSDDTIVNLTEIVSRLVDHITFLLTVSAKQTTAGAMASIKHAALARQIDEIARDGGWEA